MTQQSLESSEKPAATNCEIPVAPAQSEVDASQVASAASRETTQRNVRRLDRAWTALQSAWAVAFVGLAVIIPFAVNGVVAPGPAIMVDVAVLFIAVLMGWMASNALAQAVQTLAASNDMAAAVPLFDLVCSVHVDPESRPAAYYTYALTGLARRLPHMNHDDTRLTERHRRKLREIITISHDPAVVSPLLHAIGNIGGKDDIRVVESLAEGKRAAGSDSSVRDAAQECLHRLHDRTQLLRPARGGSSGDATLLRAPATPQADIGAEHPAEGDAPQACDGRDQNRE